jgi:2-amino-4-hydroxy-6-hydroxymethyldihydropteridine diphosphokinase
MVSCFVSVGSNINKEKNIAQGLTSLYNTFGKLKISPIYETIAIGFEGENFYNLVVRFESDLSVCEIFELLRQLEFKHGRPLNSQKFTSRMLDLDLLLYGELIIEDEIVTLPRADIENYIFVLQPLADIAPDLKHPILQKSYAEMLLAFDSTGNNNLKEVPCPISESIIM